MFMDMAMLVETQVTEACLKKKLDFIKYQYICMVYQLCVTNKGIQILSFTGGYG